MSNLHPMLPKLIANRQFIQDLCDAEKPCFGMGLVEERKRSCGFLGLRLNEAIPMQVSNLGFSFGHALLGTTQFEVIQFSFRFYGFKTYHVLVNPNNPLVQAVRIFSTPNQGGIIYDQYMDPRIYEIRIASRTR